MSSEDRLLRNPLAFFLALAFADDAIKGVSSVEQFWEIRPRRGQKSFQSEWNKDKLDTPVFRIVNATGPTPDAWHTSSIFCYFRNAVKNAGYKESSITIHTLRRGVANVVDSKNLNWLSEPSFANPALQNGRHPPSGTNYLGDLL